MISSLASQSMNNNFNEKINTNLLTEKRPFLIATPNIKSKLSPSITLSKSPVIKNYSKEIPLEKFDLKINLAESNRSSSFNSDIKIDENQKGSCYFNNNDAEMSSPIMSKIKKAENLNDKNNNLIILEDQLKNNGLLDINPQDGFHFPNILLKNNGVISPQLINEKSNESPYKNKNEKSSPYKKLIGSNMINNLNSKTKANKNTLDTACIGNKSLILTNSINLNVNINNVSNNYYINQNIINPNFPTTNNTKDVFPHHKKNNSLSNQNSLLNDKLSINFAGINYIPNKSNNCNFQTLKTTRAAVSKGILNTIKPMIEMERKIDTERNTQKIRLDAKCLEKGKQEADLSDNDDEAIQIKGYLYKLTDINKMKKLWFHLVHKDLYCKILFNL